MTRPHAAEASEPPAIHPLLAKALNCVDVQLETELARYRRQIADSGQSRRETVLQSSETAIAPPSPTPSPQTPPLPQSNPLNLKFASEGSMVHQPQVETSEEIPPDDPLPNDYLASSEQLLRNLDSANPRPEPEPSTSLPERLLTPLGIAAMAFLCGAIALLGAAIFDPEMLTTWRLNGNSSDSETLDTLPPAEPETESDRDSNEDLDLDNLGNIQPQTQTTLPNNSNAPNTTPPPSAVPPNYSIPGSSSDLTNALVPPLNPSPQGASSASPSPSPEAPPIPQNIEPAPGPSSSDYYYVLADYSGPNSLQQAQGVIPDAYVRQFDVGDRIQMGAFLTQADANELANRLEDQGLPVSVYRP